MVWVYGHYKYFISYRAGIVFIRQILTYKDDPRTERVNVGQASQTVAQKNIQKSEKNSFFFGILCLFVIFVLVCDVVHVSKKKNR